MSLDIKRYKILKSTRLALQMAMHEVGDIVEIPISNKIAIAMAGSMVNLGYFEHIVEPLELEEKVKKVIYNGSRNGMDIRFAEIQQIYAEYFTKVLDTMEQHLKDLEATGDIQRNSNMSWEEFTKMYRKEVK